ncbi:MAG TPA: hypothetical protein VGR00_12695 [Thermoanaerobaculia bacterium]|nr:hypothetical protein [Thermoanaerobaculia bacterium]
MSKKELSSAWSVLRFTLRDAAKQFSSANATRVGALPADPPDPERVELVVKSVLREIESIGEAGEKSPILRVLKRTIAPSDADKAAKKLTKAFNDYLKAWGNQPRPAA